MKIYFLVDYDINMINAQECPGVLSLWSIWSDEFWFVIMISILIPQIVIRTIYINQTLLGKLHIELILWSSFYWFPLKQIIKSKDPIFCTIAYHVIKTHTWYVQNMMKTKKKSVTWFIKTFCVFSSHLDLHCQSKTCKSGSRWYNKQWV